MKHFDWDYENSTTRYYHIYPLTDEADDLIKQSAITLTMEQHPLADVLVEQIVVNLSAMAEASK